VQTHWAAMSPQTEIQSVGLNVVYGSKRMLVKWNFETKIENANH
jgi:hypothetical protein